jgi:hypothetical protein
MNSSVQLTEYAGLVAAVSKKLTDALTPQLGKGHKDAAARTQRQAPRSTPAERALNLRFGMGGDTVTYINNGVALLAAGTASDAIDVSGLVSGDVLAGVKNAIYNELGRRERLELQNAPQTLDDVRSLAAWLLCIPEVACALALGDNLPAVLFKHLQTIGELRGSHDTEDQKLAAEAVQRIVQEEGIVVLGRILRGLLKLVSPREESRRVVDRLLADIEGTHGLTDADLVDQFRALEAEIANDVALPAGGVDNWLADCKQGATEITDALPIARWVQMAGLVGEVGPEEAREVAEEKFPYHMSLLETLSLPRDKADIGFGTTSDPTDRYVTEIARNGMADNGLGICLLGCKVVEPYTAVTMPVRWLPHGSLKRDQCRAAVLEHVVQNMWEMQQWGEDDYKERLDSAVGGDGSEADEACMRIAASAKLLQLEHLQRIRAHPAKARPDVPKMWTPNAGYRDTGAGRHELLLGAPFLRKPGSNTVTAGPGTREEVIAGLDPVVRDRFKASEVTAETHAATLRDDGKWPYGRVIPSADDFAVLMGDPVPGSTQAVAGSKRKASGRRAPVEAKRLSADSLAGCAFLLEQGRSQTHTLRVAASVWQGISPTASGCAVSSRPAQARTSHSTPLPSQRRPQARKPRAPRSGMR